MSSSYSSAPSHPGAILRTKLAHIRRPQAQVARLLGLSRQTVHEITTGKQSITANVALRVAKLTGTSPEMWLVLQNAYDLTVARRAAAEQLARIPVLEEAW